jgi:hypothetical protein
MLVDILCHLKPASSRVLVLGAHPTRSDLCSQIRVALHGGGAPHGREAHPLLHSRLRATRPLRCRYGIGSLAPRLVGYSNNDLGRDVDSRKSISDMFFLFLGSIPLTWRSQTMKLVDLSSCESKYMATATTAWQGSGWLSRWCSRSTTSRPSRSLRIIYSTTDPSTLCWSTTSFGTAWRQCKEDIFGSCQLNISSPTWWSSLGCEC